MALFSLKIRSRILVDVIARQIALEFRLKYRELVFDVVKFATVFTLCMFYFSSFKKDYLI